MTSRPPSAVTADRSADTGTDTTGTDTTRPRLADLTTLRLGGPARALHTVTTEAELAQALAEPEVLVIGGGSNLVVADAGVDATVVRIALPGIAVDGDLVTIGAGVDWEDAVAEIVAGGRTGLAPLSGIPGSTGATPVQNVGAYGTELGELLASVRVYDRVARTFAQRSGAELGLTYRSSALRGQHRFVVSAVTLRLGRLPGPVRYAELARTLGVPVGTDVPEAEVRAAVLELRRRKGMLLDPADPDTRSAGSFFTNPILDEVALARTDAAIRRRLPAEHHGYPRYPGPVGTKLSAAWLIERAGFSRGFPGPSAPARLSSKHTLALVNAGGSTADLLALAAQVRAGVRAAFEVTLEPEPVLVGVALPSG